MTSDITINFAAEIVKCQLIIEERTQTIIKCKEAIGSINTWLVKNNNASFFDVLPTEIILMIVLYLKLKDLLIFKKSCKKIDKIIVEYCIRNLNCKKSIIEFLNTKLYNGTTIRKLLDRSEFECGIVACRSKYVLSNFGRLLGIFIFNKIIIFRTINTPYVCVSLDPSIEYFIMPHHVFDFSACIHFSERKIQDLFQKISTNRTISPTIPFSIESMNFYKKEILSEKTPFPSPLITSYGLLCDMFGVDRVKAYADVYKYISK